MRPRIRRRNQLLFLAVFVLAPACRAPLIALARDAAPAEARANGEQLFAALGARVTDPSRDLKYDSARVKIARAAFLPSRVWDDTAVWSLSGISRRTLFIDGRMVGGRYHLDAARGATPVTEPAESRHVINLTQLSPDEYAWDTDVAYGIGSVTAPQVGAFVAALLASGEGRTEREVRADYSAAVPLTSAALGQLFSVDSIRTTLIAADRSTITTFSVSMRPASVERRFPNFAKYLRSYVETGRMRWQLTDRAGAPYMDCSAANGHLMLRVRTLDGTMIPIIGNGRPLPDSLALVGEFTMKVRHFTMGFHDYHAEFTIIRGDHERAWSIVTRREPAWVLPLITERLLRTSLRRPFQASGALFRIGVRDSAGGQSILHRRMHLEVQESTILRFVGRLGSIAASEYAGRVEREENAFLREVFSALVADVRALR